MTTCTMLENRYWGNFPVQATIQIVEESDSDESEDDEEFNEEENHEEKK